MGTQQKSETRETLQAHHDPRVLEDACRALARAAGELGLAAYAVARLADDSWASARLGAAFGGVWSAACRAERALCHLLDMAPPPRSVRSRPTTAQRPQRPEREVRDGDS